MITTFTFKNIHLLHIINKKRMSIRKFNQEISQLNKKYNREKTSKEINY